MTHSVQPKIITIDEILKKPLRLPEYQRPYKWQIRHVQQLLSDLLNHFREQKTYRIGTVVLHNHQEKGDIFVADIVDGQQRLTTLTLLLYAMGVSDLQLLEQEYKHSISQDNIVKNNAFIKNFLMENCSISQNDFKDYILERCEMVCVQLNNLDEAFQFFDSQNARGKPLEAYDLLKAYHLRAMQGKTENTIHQCVSQWEQSALADEHEPNLHKIINQMLYRLRVWQIGQSGETFSSNELSVFKGVSENSSYPYVQAALASQALANFTAANPFLFQAKFTQPSFQAKQTMIDGEWFFAYIQHYRQIYRQLFGYDKSKGLLSRIYQINGIELGQNLIDFLNNHAHANRTGDRYLRSLFECLVLAYFDKFGEERLENFVNKAFVWVYRIRLEWQRITFATINNTAMAQNSLLTHLDRSYTPDAVMMFSNPPVIKIEFESVDETIKHILAIQGEVK